MLADTVRILDFDGSLIRQKNLLSRYRPGVVDVADLGPRARLWAGGKTAAAILDRLDPGTKHAITFLGSGDFHHVSGLLLRQFAEPLTLIVFDFHPDWDVLPPRLACGAWVSRALEQPSVGKVILLGPSSDDLSSPAIHTGNLQALKNGRLEIYPYAHEPTRVMFRAVPPNPSMVLRRKGLATEIVWIPLQGRCLESFMEDVLRRCGTRRVYVSIDKDCLRSDHALTNWEEGRLGLDELLALLRSIKDKMEIVGLDIAGEYSAPVMTGRFKSFCSRLDHPAAFTAASRPQASIDAVNERTNLELLNLLLGR